MGRQINFYFVKDDELKFLARCTENNVTFLQWDVELPQNTEYSCFEQLPYDRDVKKQLFICLRSDLPNIKYKEIESKWFYIDSTTSPVIEFTRSGIIPMKNILVSGRLWFEMKYWDKDKNGNSILVTKDKKLEELYNSLAKWIRKYCMRLPNGNYIGPHAMELYKNGATLSP